MIETGLNLAAILQLLNILGIPAVALLWRISNQLTAVQSVQLEHARRLQNLESKKS